MNTLFYLGHVGEHQRVDLAFFQLEGEAFDW